MFTVSITGPDEKAYLNIRPNKGTFVQGYMNEQRVMYLPTLQSVVIQAPSHSEPKHKPQDL